jgi:drug/metabolite transporter (DMT)-like permease
MADLPSLGVIAVSLAISAVLYAPAAAFDAPKRPLSADVIASVAALTVVCTALAFVVFFALITEVGPVRSTVITYINPAVAVLLGVTVLGEHFGVGTGVGFVLIVAGCLLATRRDTEPVPPARRRRHLEEDGTRPVPALGSD